MSNSDRFAVCRSAPVIQLKSATLRMRMVQTRCGWVNPSDALYVAYHDTEWGVPEYDGRALWEKLVLDGFQAGLAWITILRKREAFRAAFKGFDPEIVARFGEKDRARL